MKPRNPLAKTVVSKQTHSKARRVDHAWGWEVGGSGSERKGASFNDPRPTTHDPRRAAPYWYPFQTNGGAIREDRLVFPIPPGTRWQDVRAVEVPVTNKDEGGRMKDEGKTKKKALPGPRAKSGSSFIPHPSSLPHMVAIIVGGRVKYVPKPGRVEPAPAKPERKAKAERASKPKAGTIDPKYLTAARELRDRYLEHVNGERVNDQLLLRSAGKYDVSRALSSASTTVSGARVEPARALPAQAA
jgi:hypothetical protein